MSERAREGLKESMEDLTKPCNQDVNNFGFESAPSTQLSVTSVVGLFRNILCPDRIKIVLTSASFQQLVSLCLLTLWGKLYFILFNLTV